MTRRDWRDQALCREVDPDEFVPDVCHPGIVAELKAICGRCPVAKTCLTEALAEEHGMPAQLRCGIRGGTTPRERHAIANRRKRSLEAAA
ncbi:WhiB family transcriptional regulator [Streptomyces sp. TM32]|uniref:WhiB family transcriptional regulator n=1 Tax=Streptomyces sp. TM32 TaxID=1652669 RepID=UPI001010128F|nr:WhiB family transcriptional regulator [Streptomyces sp. TM32]RXS78884.1 WhiB family transcriptional regulator [Streptomyces sp. TM32]